MAFLQGSYFHLFLARIIILRSTYPLEYINIKNKSQCRSLFMKINKWNACKLNMWLLSVYVNQPFHISQLKGNYPVKLDSINEKKDYHFPSYVKSWEESLIWIARYCSEGKYHHDIKARHQLNLISVHNRPIIWTVGTWLIMSLISCDSVLKYDGQTDFPKLFFSPLFSKLFCLKM